MSRKKNISKIALFICIVFFSVSAFAENTYQENTIQKDSLKSENVVSYEVFGMDCPGCQSALEKQIKKIEGVAEVAASFVDKEVLIEFQPEASVTEEEIFERIKKANFTPGKKKISNADAKKEE